MASIKLPSPGTKYGPCATACDHKDCAEIKTEAVKQCAICDTIIGYETRFYGRAGKPVHAICLEDQIDAERREQ